MKRSQAETYKNLFHFGRDNSINLICVCVCVCALNVHIYFPEYNRHYLQSHRHRSDLHS